MPEVFVVGEALEPRHQVRTHVEVELVDDQSSPGVSHVVTLPGASDGLGIAWRHPVHRALDGGQMTEYPQLLHTALDTTDARGLAEFYRELLGLQYRPGDYPPADGGPDDADWLVLVDADGNRRLAFQQVDELTPTTWPTHEVPMQLHIDFT